MSLKLKENELFVLSTFIEDSLGRKQESRLNAKGVKELAKIYAKIGCELLDMDLQYVLKQTEERFLESINHTDKN